MFRVNVIAVIEMVQLVSRLMAEGHGGSIVNIASVTAVLGSPGQSAYSANQGGDHSFHQVCCQGSWHLKESV